MATPLMSPYLLALTVGNITSLSTTTGGIPDCSTCR